MQINLENLYNDVTTMLDTVQPIPNYKQGKSIVTSVYNDEFASGFVLMCELARLVNTLPIEIFYRPGELSQQQIELLQYPAPELISVKCINGNAKDFITQYGTRAGWSTKIYAIWESEYAENLWIDSDNYPIKPIDFLFNDVEYKQKHCLFWRDVVSVDRANRYYDDAPIWKIFNVPINDAEPFEAGQLLINKPLCWQQLRLVKHYADNCEIYYNFGGDTETFRFAWQHLYARANKQCLKINYHSDPNVPYGFMPYGPFHKGIPNQFGKWGGGTVMVQRDRYGSELFNHRNINKMKLTDNVYNQDCKNEDYYHAHINLLTNLLKGSNG